MTDFLTIHEVAERMNLSTSRIYQMISKRELPATRFGRAVKVPRVAYDVWLRAKSVDALSTIGPTSQNAA